MKRPDQIGIALLQARHVLNEWEDSQVFLINANEEEDHPPVHPYAWGLFKSTLLKAMKNRDDLKEWSPELFHGDQSCPHCNGEGKNPIPYDHRQYREQVEDSLKDPDWAGNFKDGDSLWWFCTPCQSSGILTRLNVARINARKNQG